MMHRIRKAMKDDSTLLSGIVEMDETYVSGNPRKKNKKDDEDKTPPMPRGRAIKKTPVASVVQRGGNVKAKSTSKFELAFRDFLKFVRKNIDIATSILITVKRLIFLAVAL